MKRIRSALGRALIALALFIGIGGPSLYFAGLAHRIDPLPEPDETSIPTPARSLIWAEFGGEGPIPERFPAGTLRHLYTWPPEPEVRIAHSAARWLTEPDLRTPHRQHAESSAAIWIIGHWSPGEAAAYIGERYFFGHESTGLQQAARTYFDASLDDLSTAQMALLVASMRAPSRWNPRCRTDTLVARAEDLALRSGLGIPSSALRAALPNPSAPPPIHCRTEP